MSRRMELLQKNHNQKSTELTFIQKKPNNILQLKDELVRMKQFLNQEMPSLSRIIKNKRQINQDSLFMQQSYDLSNQQINRLMNANHKLLRQNEMLEEQLSKQKNWKKTLNTSLKKQEQMLSNLYENTHKHLQNSDTKILSRKNSKQSALEVKNLYINNQKNKKQYGSLSKQKVSIWHKRKHSKSSDKFATQTSLQNYIQKKQKLKKKKVYNYQYSQSDQETISALKQIDELQKKIKQFIMDSQMTENRAKKLQIRHKIQKTVNKINCLKNILNN